MYSSKRNNPNKKKMNTQYIIIMGIIMVAAVLAIIFLSRENTEKTVQNDNIAVGQDITILKNDVTEKAKFYGYKANDTYIEVMAVRASDDSVRTALNTCQVCNNSGKGYYEQDGDILICQNCGNQFTIDQIGLVKDGCNPVPIEQSIKTEDEEKIVIKGDGLAEYQPLFAVWKK